MEKKVYIGLFFLLFLVYIPGLYVPLMASDSAHHANIALRMYLDNDYAFLIDKGRPYLDKPHFLFWTAALSYHVFGVTAFAYKFPSFLFTILGTYSTYRLGWLLYNKEVGKLAALIVATAFAYVLAANDVRMDAILTAAAIFALWQLCSYIEKKKTLNLVLAALGLAIGFATKGWVGAVVPAFALFLHLLYKRNWPMLFHGKWLLLVFLFFLFVSPVLYAYYLQFDLHPELHVRGRSHISGVRFILWDQNFERMKGESFGAKGNRDYAFFLHTFLWAFLPWSFLYFLAIISRAKTFVQARFRYQLTPEFMTFGAALFFMALFSLSMFKLPHYLNILFPLFALLLASHLHECRNNRRATKAYWAIQVFVLLSMALFCLVLNLWIFPIHEVWVMAVATLLLLLWFSTLFLKLDLNRKTIYWSVTGVVFVLFLHNANFYPQLLTYQAGTVLANVSKERDINRSRVFLYRTEHSSSYDFNTAYFHKHIALETIEELKQQHKHMWVITNDDGLSSLQERRIPILKQFRAQSYHVSKVKWEFLNPNTRSDAITYLYLIHL